MKVILILLCIMLMQCSKRTVDNAMQQRVKYNTTVKAKFR